MQKRPTANDEGLSLIEMMIAIFILGVALIALAGVAGQSLTSLRVVRDREQATNAASSAIEEVRERNWADIVLSPGVVIPSALAPADCFDGEPVVRNVSSNPVDFERSAGDDGRITVRTLVTWADGTCSPLSTSEAKRVVTLATWTDRGVDRVVRQETVVAPAARGLPVPEFDVDPPQKPVVLSSGLSTDETCTRHQLRNLGAPDTYEWRLASVNGVDTGTSYAGPGWNSHPGLVDGGWKVRAYFGYPSTATVSELPHAVLVTESPAPLEMRDLDGDFWPEAVNALGEPIVVDPATDGRSADLWFCWQPTAASEGDSFEAELAVHSRFDENRSETVQHSVSVGTATERWYLFDPIDNQAHDRGVVQGSNLTFPPYRMGPQVTVEDSPERLGTIDYSDAALSDWDRNLDDNQQPGVRLQKAATDGRRALQWHEQLTQATTLEPEIGLRFWIAPPYALAGGPADPLANRTLRVRVTLEKLRSNENTVLETLYTEDLPITFSVDASGFREENHQLVLAAPPTFEAQQFLRLRISCLSTSEEDCVVAYDNVGYQSALSVVPR